MLPPTAPLQFPALASLATGPFSYIFQLNTWKRRNIPGVKYTNYPAPDGGWEWKTCFARDWSPELAGCPVSKNT